MLLPKLLTPDVATAALRRLRPTAAQLAEFKGHLAELRKHLDPTKIERHAETHILNFLLAVTRPPEGVAATATSTASATWCCTSATPLTRPLPWCWK